MNGIDTGVVEATAQLGAQPLRLIAFLDIQLEHQRIDADRSGLLAIDLTRAVVDQSLAQVAAVDVIGERGIVAFIDQQRKRNAMQHPLDGTLPLLFVRFHLDQLTDKGQRTLRYADGRGDLMA